MNTLTPGPLLIARESLSTYRSLGSISATRERQIELLPAGGVARLPVAVPPLTAASQSLASVAAPSVSFPADMSGVGETSFEYEVPLIAADRVEITAVQGSLPAPEWNY